MKEPRALCMTGLLCAFLCHAAYPFWPGRPLGCVCPGHGFAPQRSHLYHGAARSYTVRRRFRRDVLWHVEWHVRARRGMSGGWVAWRGTRGCCLGRMLHHQLCSMVTLPSLDMLFGLHYETAHGIHFTTQSDISQLLLHLLRVNPSGFLQPFLYDLQSCSV